MTPEGWFVDNKHEVRPLSGMIQYLRIVYEFVATDGVGDGVRVRRYLVVDLRPVETPSSGLRRCLMIF